MTKIEKQISELRLKGVSFRDISEILNIPKSTVFDIYTRLLRDSKIPPQAGPKILILDIETAPTLAWVWKRFKENIGQPQVVAEGYILTWSAKWLGSDKVTGDSLHHYPNYLKEGNDYPLALNLHKILEEADIVVAHNGDKFDIPTINARMIYHGFKPPKPFKTIDTLKILKKHFRLPSNSLNSACEYFGMGNKVDTGGFSLWARCMQQDLDAFQEMLDYNIQDVILLEKLYIKLAPWYTVHPSVVNYAKINKKTCTVCGSSALIRKGEVSTNVSTFDAYQCGDCGHWSRGRFNLKLKEEMNQTLINIA